MVREGYGGGKVREGQGGRLERVRGGRKCEKAFKKFEIGVNKI